MKRRTISERGELNALPLFCVHLNQKSLTGTCPEIPALQGGELYSFLSEFCQSPGILLGGLIRLTLSVPRYDGRNAAPQRRTL